GTCVLMLQQFWERPPNTSTQISAPPSASGTRDTQDGPVQFPGPLEHLSPAWLQLSSCADTPLDSFSRQGLDPPVPGVAALPVVGASVMLSLARNSSLVGGQSRESVKTLFVAKVSSTFVLPSGVHGFPWFGPPLQVPCVPNSASQRGQTRVRSVRYTSEKSLMSSVLSPVWR